MLSVVSGVWNRLRNSSEREMIPVSFAFFLCFSFLQKSFHYFFYIYIFIFSWKLFLFFHVTVCSGMFRNVPECSVFHVLSTPSLAVALLRSVHAWVARRGSSLSCVRLNFPLLGNFYVRTWVKFTLANKIEAIYERLHISIKVEPRSTSRLFSTLYILPLFYLSD